MPYRMTGYLGGYETYRNMFINSPEYRASELGHTIHDILHADSSFLSADTIRDILYATSSSFLPNTYIDVDNELSNLESILQTMSKNNQLLEEAFLPEQSQELDSFLCIFEGGDKL